MLMKPENGTRITTQIVPWVAGGAAEAVLVTHGTTSLDEDPISLAPTS
jgi:L-asparaginase/Glu-tRNA(Gln) amidotransferase subunit D